MIQDEAEAMRVVRDQKELVDSIENMDPTEYPVILQTLFDIMEDGDVPLAKAISDLINKRYLLVKCRRNVQEKRKERFEYP